MKHHGYFLSNPAQVRLGEIRRIFVGHDDAAAIGFEKTHDMGQGNRLTDAAAADDGYGLAGIHPKIAVD